MAPNAPVAKPAPQQPKQPQGNPVLVAWKLAGFTVLMVTAPLVLFFASVEGYLDGLYAATFGIPSPEKRTAVAAIAAVLGVNAVVAAFVYFAFRELAEDEPKDAKKKAGKQE